jgi:hypothetical protein
MSQQQSFMPGGSTGIVNQVTGTNGVTASPTTGNVVVSGVQSTTTQIGVVTLATNAETVAGTDTSKVTTPDDIKAKLGTQTLHGLAYGNSTTGAVQWLAEATDGQIPIGDTGGVPILANIISSNGTVTVTNGPGSIDLSVTNENVGTATTVGAVTSDIITIPLGGVAGTFQFEARVKAFDAATPSGAGYNIYATLRTDGATATLIGNQDVFNEDAALSDADAYFIASGNNAVLQVLGVTGLTINWSAETEIT